MMILDVSNPFNCEWLNQTVEGYYSRDKIVICSFFRPPDSIPYKVCIIEYPSYPSISNLPAASILKPFLLLKKKKGSLKKRSW